MKLFMGILVSTFVTLGQAASAEVKPEGSVVKNECATQVSTEIKLPATNVRLAGSLCRAKITGDLKNYYTVDSEVWMVLPNRIYPPQVQLVGTVGDSNMIELRTATDAVIGSVVDNGNEISLTGLNRTVVGQKIQVQFHTESK